MTDTHPDMLAALKDPDPAARATWLREEMARETAKLFTLDVNGHTIPQADHNGRTPDDHQSSHPAANQSYDVLSPAAGQHRSGAGPR